MSESSRSGVERVARALLDASRDQRPADAAPLERLLSGPDEAYAAQELVAREAGCFERAVPRYWKAGGPTPSVFTNAPLPPKHVWASPADASRTHFNVRMIEAEVALRLARDVTAAEAAGLTHEAAAALVDAMAVSIEIVDSRWRQGRDTAALLKLADLQSHGALVLAEFKPFAPRDWAKQKCSVRIGNAPVREFQGSYGLGDPAWLLPVWLRHVTRKGDTATKGTVVTTGTWCGMLEAHKGEKVRVEFEGIGSAEVQL